MALFTAVSDEEIVTQVKDYSFTRQDPICEVNYAQLRSGFIRVEGREIPAVPLSSYVRAKEIAEILKSWIEKGEFMLGEPQNMIPSVPRPRDPDTKRA
jgi:uncharacterized protein (DUF39 family)